MVLSNLKVCEVTERSALELIEIFQRTPYRFMYESDIQALLFSKIRESIPDSLYIEGTGHPLDQYEVSVVHTEYWRRIDVACLDVERVRTQKTRVHMGMDVHIYELPVLIGIELKYRKLGDRFGLEACISDFDKLISLDIESPLVFGFIQNDQDVESFFSVNLSDYAVVEVDLLKPLEKINIISPTKRWTITVNS